MLIVLTGPNSSLGTPIRRALKQAGHAVIRAKHDHYDLSTRDGIEGLAHLCERADALVHCAGIMQPDEDPRWQDSINALSYMAAIRTLPINAPAIAMLDNTGTLKLHRHFHRYYQSKALLRRAVLFSTVPCRPIGIELGYVTKHDRQSAKSFNRLRTKWPGTATAAEVAEHVQYLISTPGIRNTTVDLSGGMPYIAP